jgi:hypothetical protein
MLDPFQYNTSPWGQSKHEDNWKLLIAKVLLLYLFYTNQNLQNQNKAIELKFQNILIIWHVLTKLAKVPR